MAHPLDASARKYLSAQKSGSKSFKTAASKKNVAKEMAPLSSLPGADSNQDDLTLPPPVMPITKGARGSTKAPRIPQGGRGGDPLDAPQRFAEGGRVPASLIDKNTGKVYDADLQEMDLDSAEREEDAPGFGGKKAPKKPGFQKTKSPGLHNLEATPEAGFAEGGEAVDPVLQAALEMVQKATGNAPKARVGRKGVGRGKASPDVLSEVEKAQPAAAQSAQPAPDAAPAPVEAAAEPAAEAPAAEPAPYFPDESGRDFNRPSPPPSAVSTGDSGRGLSPDPESLPPNPGASRNMRNSRNAKSGAAKRQARLAAGDEPLGPDAPFSKSPAFNQASAERGQAFSQKPPFDSAEPMDLRAAAGHDAPGGFTRGKGFTMSEPGVDLGKIVPGAAGAAEGDAGEGLFASAMKSIIGKYLPEVLGGIPGMVAGGMMDSAEAGDKGAVPFTQNLQDVADQAQAGADQTRNAQKYLRGEPSSDPTAKAFYALLKANKGQARSQ